MAAPSGALQRASGAGLIEVRTVAGGVTRLQRLGQEGCAQIRLPRDPGSADPTAIAINTAGGLTGGDRLDWTATAGAGARLTVTTQACEKVYRSLGADAETRITLTAGAGARLDWLPQEAILFDAARLSRRIEADIAADASLLVCEAVILGRAAMGEQVASGALRDRWRIRRGAALVFAEEFALDDGFAAVAARAAALGAAGAFASVLLVAPGAETRLAAARSAIGGAGGVSAWNGKLFARILAPDGMALRHALIPLLAALRDAPLPRAWSL